MTAAGGFKAKLDRGAAAITAWRSIQRVILDQEGRAMSIIDKMDAIGAARAAFNTHADEKLDALQQRYAKAPEKLDTAVDKHHARLDAEEKAFDDLGNAIDRLSNSGNS